MAFARNMHVIVDNGILIGHVPVSRKGVTMLLTYMAWEHGCFTYMRSVVIVHHRQSDPCVILKTSDVANCGSMVLNGLLTGHSLFQGRSVSFLFYFHTLYVHASLDEPAAVWRWL